LETTKLLKKLKGGKKGTRKKKKAVTRGTNEKRADVRKFGGGMCLRGGKCTPKSIRVLVRRGGGKKGESEPKRERKKGVDPNYKEGSSKHTQKKKDGRGEKGEKGGSDFSHKKIKLEGGQIVSTVSKTQSKTARPAAEKKKGERTPDDRTTNSRIRGDAG